ncbi:hypothetical protein L249_8440 [Ophiocordyceps polyrhachis-furcata BCC 54312]|uniref:Uncharacterized protein n=1 Tax=Ophiocordyceps polyrhachis-furcata BCC 54312 TaxID=1330021 RepID=A0A367L7C1_9HYPO|nr:hypothetical protein L249_8440 [Ophiocordyceps polyrhachis-furcata BCC 54312]
MAIRDRIRRVLHKTNSSSGSDSSSRSVVPDGTTTSDMTTIVKTTSPPSTFARVFNNLGARSDRGGDDGRRREPRMPRTRRRGRKIHPSLRPLTAQNLQHQEMLSHFTMTFGATDPDQIESLSFCGISPCCTRTPSVQGDLAALQSTDTEPGLTE